MSGSPAVEGCPAFEVSALEVGPATGLVVRGEIELATAPELTAALDDAIRESAGPFFLDLSLVDFLDSTGMCCLVRARALLGRDERPLLVVCPPGAVRRALRLARLDELLVLYASTGELAGDLEASWPGHGSNAPPISG